MRQPRGAALLAFLRTTAQRAEGDARHHQEHNISVRQQKGTALLAFLQASSGFPKSFAVQDGFPSADKSRGCAFKKHEHEGKGAGDSLQHSRTQRRTCRLQRHATQTPALTDSTSSFFSHARC